MGLVEGSRSAGLAGLQPDKRLKLVGVLGFGAAAAIPLYLSNPSGSGIFPPCPFLALTGFFCPGCGTTRGLYQLLHGNVVGALDFNPLMVATLPFLGYALLSLTLDTFTGRPLPALFRSPLSTWFVFAVVASFWVLRNIPAFPFTLLAP